MKPESTTLVIARYNEDLEWITEVPEHFRIVIYNKGTLIPSLSALQRADVIETRDNVGRESETMIHHLMTHRDEPNEWTVFCQGDPFEHSPDFLDLLKVQDSWRDVQSLSYEWCSAKGIPPRYLLERETDECIGNLRVRTEIFSLYLWTASRFADKGSLTHLESYSGIHDLPEGANMAAHFLSLAGLEELAADADSAECGRFSYGAIFAVRSRLMRTLTPEVIQKLIGLAQSAFVNAYVFERLWLHIFGEPFLSLSAAHVLTPAVTQFSRVGARTGDSGLKIFTTITPAYEESCQEWLIASLREVEPSADLTIECFDEVKDSPDFQSATFHTHNHHRNRKLVEWIRQNTGGIIFLTDADIIYLKPFVETLIDELGNSDMAFAMESFRGGYNIGQMVIRCSPGTEGFFESVGQEMKLGEWDQAVVNRLLAKSGLRSKPLSRRFAITATWKNLSARERANVLSYHATGTDPRDGKSSIELKREYFAEVLAEWNYLRGADEREGAEGAVLGYESGLSGASTSDSR